MARTQNFAGVWKSLLLTGGYIQLTAEFKKVKFRKVKFMVEKT